MSWGFGGVAANNLQGEQRAATSGPDLEAIETEQLGFQALNGEKKLRLFASPWPADALPSKTASLLAVANGRKLLVAAGPGALNLYDTDALRSSFEETGKGNIQDVSPKISIPTPRLSQIAFTSDENALIITAEQGGGLAIYEIAAASANWSASFQVPTQGTAVRHLLPNPNPDASHLVAVVLVDGKLLIADLKSKAFVNGSGGNSVLREGVSCASWSKKGKQIVAGLADGTAVQLDTHGVVKDTLQTPPSLSEQLPVTAIYWLENLEFLLVHSPLTNQSNEDDGMSPLAEVYYHLVLRDKDTKVCSFHRFQVDPCPPMIDERLPAHHFIQRIRDWQPNLDDSLIVSCNASTDIGMLTRSKVALSQDLPADQISHTYTTTSFTDTRRAALPMAANALDDTFPIGMTLDLSSSTPVKKPIPNDETLDESATPLPQLCILNQEGMLSAWWFVYNEAVRQKQAAPGMGTSITTPNASAKSAFGAMSSPQPSIEQSPTSSVSVQATQTPAKPAFGQPSTPAFGQSSVPAFGKPSFGAPSTPGFGAPSSIGSSGSPWSSKNGQTTSPAPAPRPSFGAPSQLGIGTSGSAFGQTGGMSFGKPSVWGTPAANNALAPTASAFGQPSTPFGGAKPADSPFAAFAKQHRESNPQATPTGFAGFAQSNAGASPFASFNSQGNKASPFASQTKQPGLPNENSFGSTVTLSSNAGSFGSGSTFSPSKFGQPSETTSSASQNGNNKQESTGLSGFGGFKLGSTFKSDGTAKDDLPKPENPGQGLFGSAFGNSLNDTATKQSTIKEEPQEVSLSDIPEAPSSSITGTPEPAPLPPSFTPIKAEASEDAPLPPDFVLPSSKPAEDAPLPPDFLSKPVPTDSAAEEAPLPPDFLSSNAQPAQELPKLPDLPDASSKGAPLSPPEDKEIDTGETGPDDDDESEEWEGASDEGQLSDDAHGDNDDGDDDDDDDDAEGEWEEEEDSVENDNEDDDENHTPQITDPTGLSAFKSRITPASPKATSSTKQSTTPETIQKPSFTPAGFPKVPVTFPPPQSTQESPRSPSPVRTDRVVTSPVRHTQHPPSNSNKKEETSKLKTSTGASSLFHARPPPPPPVEDLEDEDDAHAQQILSAPIQPTLTLPDFIAHQDYTGKSSKDGIAGQLERVYRDVNGMIDTLGLNARALQAFIAAHDVTKNQSSIDNLDDAEWTIGEIYALEKLQVTISDQLEGGKLTDIAEKVDDIIEQDDSLARLTAKAAEVRKQIALRTDPDKRAQQQAAALPPETAAQQAELRQNVQNVQRLLAKVEDSMSVLRAELATVSATSAMTNNATAMPTVEAVTKTILKMTAMIEKRSGDVDLLEAQLRNLPGGAGALAMSASYEDGLIDSLAASRLSNGASHAARLTKETSGMSSMFGSRLGASTSSLRQSTFSPATSQLGRSTVSLAGNTRRKMADVSTEEIAAWKNRASQRRDVLDAFKRAVEKSGQPTVVRPRTETA